MNLIKKTSNFNSSLDPDLFLWDLHKINLGKLVSLLFNNKFGRPLILEKFQLVLLDLLWKKKFPMVLMCRGGSKSFILALYALLKAIFYPGSEIVIIGAGFRQGKIVMQYIEGLITFSPIIQETLQKHCKARIWGVKYGTDRAYIDVGPSSKILALPIGDGGRIRGTRACVDPMTIVETNKGLMRIGDLVNSPQSIEIYNGDIWERPKHFIKTLPIDAYRVKLQYGYEIIISDIHRIWTDSGWKDIKTLSTEDQIPLYYGGKFNEESTIPNDFAWWLGAVLAEGCCSQKYRVTFKNSEPSFIRRFEDVSKKYFDSVSTYYQAPRQDKRGWTAKESWEVHVGRLKDRQMLYEKYNLDYSKARQKKIPSSILNGSKDNICAFLAGLFEGDGSAFLYKDKTRDNNFGLAFYTGSEQLSKDVQNLLLKLGIFSSRSIRKSKLSELPQYTVRIQDQTVHNFMSMVKIDKFNNIYNQSNKDIKHKALHTFTKMISIEKLSGKHVLYDFMLPKSESFIGNGIKNHNSTLICDEFAEIDPRVFDYAVAPFLSTHADPSLSATKNRVVDRLLAKGVHESTVQYIDDSLAMGNQMVIAGTASYEFNHFYKRYCTYKALATSKGNEEILKRIIRELSPEYSRGKIPQNQIDLYKKLWKEYTIFQLPYNALPQGFLDESIIATHKLIMPPTIFGHEYECRFSKDTHGFFKRSIIYEATPQFGDAHEVHFEVMGEPGYNYVMGLDPARHNDNFGLVILKLDGQTSKLVYCDAWDKTDFPTSLQRIRETMRRFPNIVHIAMDAGGGGQTMADLFVNKNLLEVGQLPIVQIDDEKHKHLTKALKILELVNFYSWSIPANYDLLSDITSKKVLFPSRVDEDHILKQCSKVMNRGEPLTDDQYNYIMNRLHGEMGDATEIKECGLIKNILYCIDEVCAIERTVTPKGTETFDLPKLTEQPEHLDIRRKDRYSALLLAAYAARVVRGTGFEVSKTDWGYMGGLASDIVKNSANKTNKAIRRNGVVY